MKVLFSTVELGRLFSIGLPIFIAQLSQLGMNFVDTIMAGRYHATALAGVAVAGSVWMPATILGVGCLLALPGMSAQLVGARSYARATHLLRQGIVLTACLCVLLGMLLYVLSCNLHHFGLDSELEPIAAGYLRALLPGLPGFFLFINMRSFLEGFGYTRPAMVIGILCLLLNIPCNYVFIYGKFGFPELGGVGCGVATSICYWFMAISMFVYIKCNAKFRALSPFTPAKESTEPKLDTKLIVRILQIGAPNSLALFMECTLFAITAILLAPLGTIVVAGHQITMNYSAMIFSVPLSIAMTSTIIVGMNLGAGRRLHAQYAAHTALVTGVVIAVVSMILTLTFREKIAILYNNDPTVVALAASLMIFCGAYQVIDTLQNVACGVLRGYNDTRIISIVCVISYGGIGLIGGYILGRTDLIVPAMGAHGFWLGYILALSFSAFCYLWRLHHLHKLSMKIIRSRLAQ